MFPSYFIVAIFFICNMYTILLKIYFRISHFYQLKTLKKGEKKLIIKNNNITTRSRFLICVFFIHFISSRETDLKN